MCYVVCVVPLGSLWRVYVVCVCVCVWYVYVYGVYMVCVGCVGVYVLCVCKAISLSWNILHKIFMVARKSSRGEAWQIGLFRNKGKGWPAHL